MTDDDAMIRAQLGGLRVLTPDPAANQAVIARRVQRRRRHQQVVAGVSLAAFVMVAGLLVAMRGGGGGRRVEFTQGVTNTDARTSTSAGEAIPTSSTLVVGGPDESSLAAVPDRNLVHGAVMQVRGSGAAPGEVQVLQCVGTTLPDRWDSRCGPASPVSMKAGSDGAFAGTVVAQRWLGGPAEFTDCAVETCSLFAAYVDGNDATALSAVPLSFAAGPEEPPRPILSVYPSSGLVDRQVVAVSGEGLPPGEVIDVAVCERQDDAAASEPSCLHTRGGTATVDVEGRLSIPKYPLAATEAKIGFDCAEPPGCELVWAQAIGIPHYVGALIEVRH